MIILTSENEFIRVVEGVGEALTQKDFEDGYVGYIYYDIFLTIEDIYDNETYDGGIIAIKKPYKELSKTKISEIVKEFLDVEVISIFE